MVRFYRRNLNSKRGRVILAGLAIASFVLMLLLETKYNDTEWTYVWKDPSCESSMLDPSTNGTTADCMVVDVAGRLRHGEGNISLKLIHDESTSLDLLDYDRDSLKCLYPEVIDALYETTDMDSVDWTKLAYVLYATSADYMCNAMMILADLRGYGTKAQLVMLVNRDLMDRDRYPNESETLGHFAKKYEVKLKPTKVVNLSGENTNTWSESFTKLLVFNETDYERIIYMDSDSAILKNHTDELFFIPPCKLASPTAYWLMASIFEDENYRNRYSPTDYGFRPLTAQQREAKLKDFLTANIYPFSNDKHWLSLHNRGHNGRSLKTVINSRNFYTNIYNSLPDYPVPRDFLLANVMMVIQPSEELMSRVSDAFRSRKKSQFDMDLVQTNMFSPPEIISKQQLRSPSSLTDASVEEYIDDVPEIMILPHQRYGALSGQLNHDDSPFPFLADSHEQLFAYYDSVTSTGEPAYYSIEKNPEIEEKQQFLFEKMNYLHFSDYPMPKPWFEHRTNARYMEHRVRCSSHKDFQSDDPKLVKPGRVTGDCSGGRLWEQVYSNFREKRKEICGMGLR